MERREADTERYRVALERIAASPRHPADPDPEYVAIAKEALDA